MFTGIIQAVGQISDIRENEDACRLTIHTPNDFLSNVSIGDSICVQGVCLTATVINKNEFEADVSAETLRCTTFSTLTKQNKVNLELALTLADHLGGHLVSGHVDGIGNILAMKEESDSICFDIECPNELAKYIAKKGSICMDGISLTVNDVQDNKFSVNIIPHTLENTAILDYQIGSNINLEVDLLARYIERIHSYK